MLAGSFMVPVGGGNGGWLVDINKISKDSNHE